MGLERVRGRALKERQIDSWLLCLLPSALRFNYMLGFPHVYLHHISIVVVNLCTQRGMPNSVLFCFRLQ